VERGIDGGFYPRVADEEAIDLRVDFSDIRKITAFDRGLDDFLDGVKRRAGGFARAGEEIGVAVSG
jgi:hypothetical protein